jgi:hypothetical protein
MVRSLKRPRGDSPITSKIAMIADANELFRVLVDLDGITSASSVSKKNDS